MWVGNPRERAPVPHLLAPVSLVAQLVADQYVQHCSCQRATQERSSHERGGFKLVHHTQEKYDVISLLPSRELCYTLIHESST